MSLIKILSLNVKGLHNAVKRRALFLYLKNQRVDLYCLHETHSKKEDEIPLPSEWGGKILFSHGTEHSKGTCIMQRPNSLFFLKSLLIDPNGRFVFAKINIGDDELFLTAVYALCDPQQQSSFTQNLCMDIASKMNTSKAIIVGDWNTNLQTIDKRGGRPWQPTTTLAKSPWDTRKKQAQNWTFVKNALRKSVALFISHCFGHCPPPSHPKQC